MSGGRLESLTKLAEASLQLVDSALSEVGPLPSLVGPLLFVVGSIASGGEQCAVGGAPARPLGFDAFVATAPELQAGVEVGQQTSVGEGT